MQVAARATANQRKVLDLAKAGRNCETISHQADQSGTTILEFSFVRVACMCYPQQTPIRLPWQPPSQSK